MKKLRWQILVVVVTLIVVAVLLLAQKPSTNPILPAPASGGIYTEAMVGSFGRLNPLLDLNNPADRAVDRLLFSGLIRFDSKGVPQPDLAESWGVSADGTIYNVTLRDNAVWQDGTPVTSDDVLFTLNLLRSPNSAFSADVRSMWDQVQITRINDKNLKFVLTEPFVPFLDYLTFGILPEHLLQSVSADQLVDSSFNLAPVGTGPYKFDHLMVDNGKITGVVLSVSANYYLQTSFIDQIVFRYYPDAKSALEAYKAGEVLGISQITPDILDAALAEPNLNLYSSRLPRMTLVLLNLGDDTLPFFQDAKVRRALLLGLNRQWMVDNVLQGQAIVADSPILPGTWAYYDGIEHVGFDSDAAAAQLKAAGYVIPANGSIRAKGDTSLSFTMAYPDDSLHAQLAQTIQQNWADIGVEVKLQAVSYDSLLNDYLTPRKYQAVLVDLDLSRSYDPDPYPFWHQAEKTGGQNYSQWDNRSASEYIEQARVLADPNIRARLYRNFQVIFARELPALLLYYPVYTYGVDQRVDGVQATPLFEPADRFNGIINWYLVTKRSLDQTKQPTVTP
ncbi:MAG TPA: ABC transporter substrate-binding protein [Anaerolineales bacterium]|nr:ABC transporter substrate-binding protein [Anaerolineales bacterium]